MIWEFRYADGCNVAKSVKKKIIGKKHLNQGEERRQAWVFRKFSGVILRRYRKNGGIFGKLFRE